MSEHTPLHDLESAAGAVFVEEAGWQIPAHYGDAAAEYRQAREQAALFDLSHQGKLELTGKEAAMFLHNLCSNDIKSLGVGSSCEAFFTTAKAKIIAHVVIAHLRLSNQESFWIDAGPGMGEKLLKHLDRHLISEQVEFADRTRDYAQLYLAGPQAGVLLEKVLADAVPDLSLLKHLGRVIPAGSANHLRRHDPLGVPGYHLVCPRDQAESFWRLFTQAGARPAGRDVQEILRIEAGTPLYGVDMDEERLVMEIGRTKEAISYTKGCFLGQEPIVMARDRGHVNRTLRGVKIAGDSPVPRGSKLLRNGEEVGVVTSSVLSPRIGGAIGLAYLRRGHQEAGLAVEVETPSGPLAAEVCSLPFTGSAPAAC